MLNQNMMNQAIVASVGPSSTSTTQSHINSLLESRGQAGIVGDLTYQSNYTNEPIDINRFLFPPRQDHPSNNFISRRYDVPAASASSFYSSATTRGSLGTTQVATPFQIYNNFISSTAAGSRSSFRSTGSGQNHSNNNNNFNFVDSFHHEIDDVFGHSTTNIQEHARVLSNGCVYGFAALIPVLVRPSSSVPPQRPLSISNPPSSNYRLHSPHGPWFSTTLEVDRHVHSSSTLTLTRPQNQVRLGDQNYILVSNFHELMAERNRLRSEVYTFLIYCEYFY
jgi:hypothetical protein